MKLINVVQSVLTLQVREASDDYIEAVLTADQLEACCGLLTEGLGAPAKSLDPGSSSTMSAADAAFAEAHGGVRNGQAFFIRRDNGRVLWALLWPWASNSRNITLKLGMEVE